MSELSELSQLGTFLLPLMASAVGGAIVAGCFGIYGIRRAKKDERDKWIRDSRLEAYSAYLDVNQSMQFAVAAFRIGVMDHSALVSKFAEHAPGKVAILARKDLLAAAEAMDAHLFDLMNEARNPRVPSLEAEDAFAVQVEELDAKRRKVVQLMQLDLGVVGARKCKALGARQQLAS